MYLLRPFVLVRFVRFRSPFGYVLRGPLYYLLQRERGSDDITPRIFDIGFWIGEAPDQSLARFWSRHIRMVPHLLQPSIARLLNVITSYWLRDTCMARHVLDLGQPEQMGSKNMNLKTYSTSRFINQEERDDVSACLESLGLSVESSVALLHVRSSEHDLVTSGEFNTRCATAEPATFQKAVNHLLELGFVVLTIGNHSSWRSNLDGVIEYHRSAERTPLRDLTLGSRASLFLGTSYGAPVALAYHFRIPLLATNHIIWDSSVNPETLSYANSVVIPKNASRTKVRLSQSECLKLNLSVSDRQLAAAGVTVEDNTQEDILAGLIELLEHRNSEFSLSSHRRESDQTRFYEVFDAHTPLPRICADESAHISPSFLKKSPWWLQ